MAPCLVSSTTIIDSRWRSSLKATMSHFGTRMSEYPKIVLELNLELKFM